MDKTTIIQILYSAIDQINEDLPDDERVTKSLNTVLFGKNAELDSMLFVNLIVAIEAGIAETFGEEISLTYQEDIYGENPLITVETLVQNIARHLEEKMNE